MLCLKYSVLDKSISCEQISFISNHYVSPLFDSLNSDSNIRMKLAQRNLFNFETIKKLMESF